MLKKTIVDSSVLVKWLNTDNEQYLEQADKLLKKARDGEIELFAPELVKYEFGNVLLKGKQLAPSEALISLSTAYSLPINFVSESEELARETYELAFDLGITYYDASFMSLAKLYDATLVTENIKHQGKSTKIKVKALRDY